MSIIFLIACFIILIGVLVAISSPFWRKDPTTPDLISQEADEDQERADLSVEREVLRQSLQAKIVQRWVTLIHSSPSRPENNAAMAKEKGIENPT